MGGPARGRVIAIASGKGGVGKTWLAISLAQALSEAGAGPVLLVDADHGLANVDVQLGLEAERDLHAVLTGRAPLAQAVEHHPAGFAVLAGRSGGALLAEPAALERMRTLVTEATLAWRIVLVDLAAGLGPTERQLAVAAHTLLVVATEEPTSLTDAYAVLKLHRQDRGGGGDSRVVVNQASDAVAGDRTWRILDRACAGFLGEGVPLAGIVRRDPRVPEAIRRQTPLLTRHPGCPAAADIRALAEALLATTLPARAA
jgi:flagellar biosynthesis protein FlhG